MNQEAARTRTADPSPDADPPPVPIGEALTRYEPVMGFEVHVELSTRSKMFCGCPNAFGAEPNTRVCPTCLGLPGSLPVINAAAVESTIMIGLALGCSIAPISRMARKNYFYPDMPKDFQISQYDEPICVDGFLNVEYLDAAGDARSIRVGIERVHMEEDTGKLSHAGGATGRIHGADYSLVDYNRAGVPLIEIVTKPIAGVGIDAPIAARAYVTALREMVRGLGVSDVRMEQGSLRCDANVSLAPVGAGPDRWGRRTETKNVNSLRSVERAVHSEIERQAGRLDAGLKIVQETRHFHENTGTSTPGRSKEEAEDYRYFPEPDLVPIEATADLVERVRARLPELPADRRRRLLAAWGVSEFEMQSVVNAGAMDLVEATVAAGADNGAARKWWLGELARRANEAGIDLADLEITPVQVARVVALVGEGVLSDKLARQVIDGVLAGEGDPDAVVAGRGLGVVSDDGPLLAAIDAAVGDHPEVVDRIRSGKVQAAGVIVGAVMKATRGRADAGRVRKLLAARLEVEL